ncbi:hypothetical protein BOTBODRAFT_396565 [Botryobasidium botryosum FD-172 SS1]|uniref:Uncharacterized protein n=1 Tax=Botryobasidium botryosum (strain FD-172 SS1) TaxID=930990 RepID=A0A067MEK5_BOTB1|nr:hypothetical protein BOTBODRAFT_396565 [Botryobasidium botryosum FD-172 SS1]
MECTGAWLTQILHNPRFRDSTEPPSVVPPAKRTQVCFDIIMASALVSRQKSNGNRPFPTVIFGAISAFALYTLIVRTALPINPEFHEHCPVSPSYMASALVPNALPYSGNVGVDTALCHLVTFFHVSFTAPPGQGWKLTVNLLASIAGPFFILYMEAARAGCPSVLAFPTAVGLLCQGMTAAAVLPLYWIALIACGSPGGIDCAVAEGLGFGLVVGYVVPTVAMGMGYENRYIVAAWQGFPLFIGVARWAYSLARPPPKAGVSARRTRRGYAVTQGILASIALVSGASHLYTMTMSTAGAFLETFRSVYLPPYPRYPYTHDTLGSAVRLLLAWDGLFTWGGALAAGAWNFPAADLARTCLVLPPVFIILGPGSAVMGVWMWRETILKQNSVGFEVPRRTE